MAAKIYRINYKSDFILTLNSDAGWMTPFCIKFWTGAPSQAFFVGWDGTTYTHCAYDPSEPTKLVVQFDDHHLPIGDLKYQVAYHFTVADFPNDTEDEVINPASITTEIDGETYQVMLDFTGETAPEIQFALPAYANEAQRIANEQQRIAAEETRIDNEAQRIQNEETRINQEQTRQDNEAQRIRNEQTRISQEEARVREFATLKHDSQEATAAANDAAALANQKAQLAADKAQLAADKAALAQDAAALANEKAQLAAAKAALANDAAALANEKAALAQQKAEYAQTQGGYAKDQGDYAKEQGDYAKRKGDDAADQMQQQAQAFSEAQAARQTAYEQAEGTESGSEAGDGSRWGAFKTNEAARDAKVDAKVADITNLQKAVAEGAVYDISANHLTEGVPTKYANLSAALGADGANIPANLRKGGMSIKYIQSSDNNYVQFRFLLSGSFTAAQFVNTANWQGVDEEINTASKNIAESGAVLKLNRQTLHNIGILAENEQYTYPNTDILFTSDQVPAGTRVYYKVNGNNARIGLYASAEATTPIDYFATVEGTQREAYYDIPSNLSYAVAKVNYTAVSNSHMEIDYLKMINYNIIQKIDSNTENVQTRDISLVYTKLPNISTHDKTLTIYQGSVIKVKKGWYGVGQDTVVDLTAASSEDKIVVYDINTHTIVAKNYDAVLSDNEAVIMSMRAPIRLGVLLVRSVSCYGTNVSIDGTDIKKVTIQNKRDIAGLLFDNHISIDDYPLNRTINGITFDIKDGAIIANGTATANAVLEFTSPYKTLSELGLKANTKYHLFGCPKGGGSGIYRFCLDNAGAGTQQYNDYGDGVDVVFANDSGKYKYIITIYSGVTADNLTFYPSLIEYTGALEAIENRTLTSHVEVFADSLPNIASSNAILSIPQMILKVVDKFYSIRSAVTLDLKVVNTQDKVVVYNTKTGSVSVKGYGDIVADTEIMLWCIRIVSNGTDYEVRSVSGVSDVMVDGSTPDKKAIYDNNTIKNALVDNLIDLSTLYRAKYSTINGITFKREGNKIIANGTASGDAGYEFSQNYLSFSELGIEAGKEYHLFGCPQGGSTTKYFFKLSNNGAVGAKDYFDYGNGCLVNPTVGKYRYLIVICNGQTVDNLVFEPALVEYKGVIKNHEERITALDNDTIANLNEDSVNGIKAATAKYMSYPNDGSNYYPAFLVITDLHGDWKRMDRALDFAENNENIKLVLLLGDIVEQSSQFNNAGNDYRARVLSMTKPVLTIVGNHEVSQDPNATHGLSDSEIFNMFYDSELVEHNGDVHPTIDGVTKNYFYRDYTIEHSGNSATIRFICLYQYEWNSPLDANNKPIYNEQTAGFGKDVGLYTQDQIDWLVETLKAAKTNDYYVVIVSHSIVGNAIGIDSIWNQPDIKNEEISSDWAWIRANNKLFINEIITSFVNGGACNVSTNQETPDGQLNPISVDTTFVAGGKFIGNVCGHKHQGAVCKLTSSDNNLNLRALISNTSSSFQQQQTNWIPRGSNGKMQDCLNVVVYDYNRDKFKVVKVGANWTADNDVINGIMI